MVTWNDRVTAGDPTTLGEYYVVCMRAEALAHRRHDLAFRDLPAKVQDEIWEEAQTNDRHRED